MVKYIKDRRSKGEILKSFEPIVRKWFNQRFNDLTPPQAMAVPLIKNKENVLVSSPTGSGKTLTAFLSILNDFFKMYRKGNFEEGGHAIYLFRCK